MKRKRRTAQESTCANRKIEGRGNERREFQKLGKGSLNQGGTSMQTHRKRQVRNLGEKDGTLLPSRSNEKGRRVVGSREIPGPKGGGAGPLLQQPVHEPSDSRGNARSNRRTGGGPPDDHVKNNRGKENVKRVLGPFSTAGGKKFQLAGSPTMRGGLERRASRKKSVPGGISEGFTGIHREHPSRKSLF